MILIVTEKNDVSAHLVADFLSANEVPYQIILLENDNDFFVNNIHIYSEQNRPSDIALTINGKSCRLADLSVIWFRRGVFRIQLPDKNDIQKKLRSSVHRHLAREVNTIVEYIYYKCKDIFIINNPLKYNLNKLIVLEYAKKLNLCIPETIIAKNFDLLNDKSSYITKTIQDLMFSNVPSLSFMQRTELVSLVDRNSRQEFYYSLFQKEVKKCYEIRVFVFFDKVFSLAIFSQQNNQTKIDFRNYDKVKPNRMVPYIIPNEIKKRLLALMHSLEIESGSIDMIYDGYEYYFLEINPVGQFDFVSKYCNYNIEKYIANFLENKYYERKKTY